MKYVSYKIISRYYLLFSERKAKNGVEQPAVIDNWVVLDGNVSAEWVDNLSSMMDSNKKLTLANSESVDSTSMYLVIICVNILLDNMFSACLLLDNV